MNKLARVLGTGDTRTLSQYDDCKFTTNGGGTHLHSTKRNRILEKIYLIPIRALDCLTNAMFSQGLLSVSVSFAASLCYVTTNTTKAQEFTLWELSPSYQGNTNHLAFHLFMAGPSWWIPYISISVMTLLHFNENKRVHLRSRHYPQFSLSHGSFQGYFSQRISGDIQHWGPNCISRVEVGSGLPKSHSSLQLHHFFFLTL